MKMAEHKRSMNVENSLSSHAQTPGNVRNDQRRWFHGTTDCVAACAQPAPRSQRSITCTKTKRTHARAWPKLRLGTASGHRASLAHPHKSTSPTQLGTYGPGYFIVPWDLCWVGAAFHICVCSFWNRPHLLRPHDQASDHKQRLVRTNSWSGGHPDSGQAVRGRAPFQCCQTRQRVNNHRKPC